MHLHVSTTSRAYVADSPELPGCADPLFLRVDPGQDDGRRDIDAPALDKAEEALAEGRDKSFGRIMTANQMDIICDDQRAQRAIVDGLRRRLNAPLIDGERLWVA